MPSSGISSHSPRSNRHRVPVAPRDRPGTTPTAGRSQGAGSARRPEPPAWLGRSNGPTSLECWPGGTRARVNGSSPPRDPPGRRPKLGAGNHTATGTEGELLYGEADAAAVLGVTKAEVSRMLDVGTGMALSRLGPVPAGVPGSVPGSVPGGVPVQPEGSFLVPVVDRDGTRWVAEAELSRCVDARETGTSPEALSATGTPDDQFPIGEAARLAGVTAAVHAQDRQAPRRPPGRHRGDPRCRAAPAPRVPRRSPWHPATSGSSPVGSSSRSWSAATHRRSGSRSTSPSPPRSPSASSPSSARPRHRPPCSARSRAATTGPCAGSNNMPPSARVTGKPVPAAGWMVATFRHLTSRALDPFPHHHNVVANTVTLEDGSPPGARLPGPLPPHPRRLRPGHCRDAPPTLVPPRSSMATRPQGRMGDRRHRRRGARRVLQAPHRDRRRPP